MDLAQYCTPVRTQRTAPTTKTHVITKIYSDCPWHRNTWTYIKYGGQIRKEIKFVSKHSVAGLGCIWLIVVWTDKDKPWQIRWQFPHRLIVFALLLPAREGPVKQRLHTAVYGVMCPCSRKTKHIPAPDMTSVGAAVWLLAREIVSQVLVPFSKCKETRLPLGRQDLGKSFTLSSWFFFKIFFLPVYWWVWCHKIFNLGFCLGRNKLYIQK